MILTSQSTPFVSEKMALFTDVVRAGEEKSFVTLPFDQRLFLINCLVEYLYDVDIVHHVLARDFDRIGCVSGALRALLLKRSGDASLILAGLFPERARHLNVSSTYFRSMGQIFYSSLAAQMEVGVEFRRGNFYNEVARAFPLLARVLYSARGDVQKEWHNFQRFHRGLD